MLSVVNVCTNSIDDLDVAREEILSQLQNHKLLKNSVGIIGCHPDYVEYGAIGAIQESLPFDVIGCSTLGSAMNKSGGLEQLTLSVLTSDDVVFSTALSDPLTRDGIEHPIEQVYANAQASLGGTPSMALMFVPILGKVIGDQILSHVNRISGGIPIFGTLGNDTSPGYTKGYIFRNGEHDRTKMALLLMSGEVNPRFYVTAIAQRNILQNNAVVTSSDGYLVSSINHMPVLDFFATLGITTSKLASVTMLPFLVDFGDGTDPVAYAMYDISEEGAHCGGAIPKGAKIAFADIDANSIMETAEFTLRSALDDVEKNGANGIIAFPCFSRGLMLNPNVDAEIIKSLEVVGDKTSFSLIYSGGEFCPMYNQQHDLVNRFHNLTYALMVF